MIEVSTREERNQFYNSSEWRTIRRQALKRDHYECVWCRDEGKVTTNNLEVDHIKELEFYPEYALDIDNQRCARHVIINDTIVLKKITEISEKMNGGGR